MIPRLIEEINRCLDIDCYLVALITALSLPDICGKAAYPDDKPSDRYIKWYDENIGQYERNEIAKKLEMPYESGTVIYSLRNSLIHEGSPDINEVTCDIQEFELLAESKETANSYVGSAGVERRRVGDEEVVVKKSLCINIRQLCFKLCIVAEQYYDENRGKFSFINNKLTFFNPHAREIFLKRR